MTHFAPLAYATALALTNLALSVLVFARNPQNLVNRLFSLSVFFVAVWIFANGMLHTFADTSTGITWGRITFAAASLIPSSFVAFALAFPSHRKVPKLGVVVTFFAGGVAFAGLAFTDTIVQHVHTDASGLRLTYGPMYPLFGIYIVVAFATSFVRLSREYRVVRGTERLKLRYLFMGTFLAVAGGATANLFIPMIFQTSRFNLLGPLFTVFAVIFIAHAVVRHRLMDIRVVLRRSTTYSLAFIAAGMVLIGLPALTYARLAPGTAPDLLATSVAVAIATAVAFPPLLRWSRKLLDHYAYRRSYDQSKTMAHVTRTLSSFLDEDDLFTYIRSIVQETVPTEYVAFYVKEGGDYVPHVLNQGVGREGLPPSVEPLDPIVIHLTQSEGPVVREELNPATDAAHRDIFLGLSATKWDLVLPLRTEGHLSGFIALGPKLSGDPYFATDIDLLGTIAGQTAVALTNARLYQEVRDVKDHLESILKSMEGGVIAVTADRTITTANTVAAGLVDHQPIDLINKPLNTLPPVLAEPLETALTTGVLTNQSEADLVTSEGSFPIVLSTSLLRDPQGEITGAILVFSDHSKFKELEEEKRRSERLADFRNMAFGIAHEIKNPLVAIKTFAELVPERYGDRDFREDFLRIAVKEVERIDELVARLRGFGEPKSRPLQRISVIEPLQETLSLLQAQLAQNRIQTERRFESGSLLIRGDFAQLKQLFLNLILNAVEAMDGRGVLTVVVRSRTQRDGSASVVVEIRDTGGGVSDAVSTRLFDPFVTSKPQGTGLGLSISRGIADAHRATISIGSRTPLPGTCVTIEFPAFENE